MAKYRVIETMRVPLGMEVRNIMAGTIVEGEPTIVAGKVLGVMHRSILISMDNLQLIETTGVQQAGMFSNKNITIAIVAIIVVILINRI